MNAVTSIATAAALVLAGLPAQANPPDANEQVKVQIGSALVCDTQDQVERFVALYDGNVQSALSAVNGEQAAKQAARQACDVATIAYVMGPEVSTARSSGGTFRVVRVLVLGVLTEQGLQASAPAAFYSAAKIDEIQA